MTRLGLLVTALLGAMACAPPAPSPPGTARPEATADPPTPARAAGRPPPEPAPGGSRLVLRRRLTRGELAATLRSLLRWDRQFPELPLDARVRSFDTTPRALPVSEAHAAALARIATEAALHVDRSGGPAALFGVPCGEQDDLGRCLDAFIRRFGRRAYRRELTAAQVASLRALAATAGDDAGRALRSVTSAVLQSPWFVYAVESARRDPAHPGRWRLDGWSVATRLALLIWGEGPDDALLDRAARGELDRDEGVRRAAADLLADPRARVGVGRFLRDWLRVYAVEWIQREPMHYPLWRDTLADDLREETGRFVDEVAWGEHADLRDLLTGPWTWMNPNVARLYGLPPPPSGGWERVAFAPDQGRAGVLTQPGVLAMTALSTRESATLRGEYVRSVLLCDPVGSPPPQAGSGDPAPPGETERERLVRHAADPACHECHDRLDPVGLGFERYDGVGTLVAERPDLTGRGTVEGLTPAAFEGPVELGRRLRASGRFESCAATQLLRFALGRAESRADDATLERLSRALVASSYRLPAMVQALATSEAFLTLGDAEVGP